MSTSQEDVEYRKACRTASLNLTIASDIVESRLSRMLAAIRHIDATLEQHTGDIPRGELVRVWDLLEGRAKTTEVSDAIRD